MGEIITFYSYKGGTGRSMALVNVAALIAKRDKESRILMIDWDLEAPGLEHYFQKYINPIESESKEGIFDFVKKAHKKLPKMTYGEEDRDKLNNYFKTLFDSLITINLHSSANKLFLLKSGKQTTDYSDQINKFNWEGFYKRIPAFFTLFADFLSEHFDYVFIDARTGHTGIGGISTMLMPEKLVLVFTPNRQGLEGIVKVAEKATNYRMNSGDLRPLMIYPLPSRVDERAAKSRQEWRDVYDKQFTELFQEIYGLPSTISLSNYFNKVQIPHSAEYAFGEKIAVLEENSTVNSLSENYRIFTQQLMDIDKIWENKPFADLQKPYQIFFAFVENDRKYVEVIAKGLNVLVRQQVIYSTEKYLSLKEWDNTIKRNLAEESYDLSIVFLSENFMKEKNEWSKFLRFDGSNKKMLINVDLTSSSEEMSSYPLTPSRRKGIAHSDMDDEMRAKIITDIRNKLIHNHGYTKQSKSTIIA
jgi:MinD-like ATPase involved in chromosome partitioning or flagellar assembly